MELQLASTSWSNSSIVGIYPATNARRHVIMSPSYKIISMLVSKLNHVSKMGPRRTDFDLCYYNMEIYEIYIYIIHTCAIKLKLNRCQRLCFTVTCRHWNRQDEIYRQPIYTPVSIRDLNSMMTSSNRNIFRVTGPLCGELTGHRWIPLTKASDAELWCFLWSTPEQTVG